MGMMVDVVANPLLAEFDFGDLVKTIIAVLVVVSGLLGSVIKSKKDEGAARENDSAPARKPKPRPHPQFPTAQPMPGEPFRSPRAGQSTPVEAPERPVVARPTAPPVVAEYPAPTIRRTIAPRPRPVEPPVAPTPTHKVEPARRVAMGQPRVGSRPGMSGRESVASVRPRREGKSRKVAGDESSTLRRVLSDQLSVKTEPTAASASTAALPALASREGLRAAFLLSEILGPPLALRSTDPPNW